MTGHGEAKTYNESLEEVDSCGCFQFFADSECGKCIYACD